MSNACTDGPSTPAPSTGSGVVVLLKQKMQNLKDDMEKYRDMYEEMCEEAETERSRRNEVVGFITGRASRKSNNSPFAIFTTPH